MYNQVTVAAVSDIPGVISSFAASAGWSVAAGNKITRPAGGIQWEIYAGTDSDIGVRDVANPTTRKCFTRSPKMNGTVGAPFVPLPSKVHLFGALLPQPYIAAVIEYGFNLYRHLYIGNMEKLGEYGGGEVISASLPWQSGDFNTFPSTYRRAAYPFSGRQRIFAQADSGGVNIIHADNPNTWRQFFSGYDSYEGGFPIFDKFTNDVGVFGGFNDGVNDGYVANGIADYAGAELLVPVNLWAVRAGGANPFFSAIGRPAGVRMVNMTNLEPAQVNPVGTDNWHCFPVFRKNQSGSQARGSAWTAEESSYMVGYAYLE
jgi:hypothetical protein